MKRELYIDILKTLAIIAVLMDHFRWVYGGNETIASASYFSVSVFIILAGMTRYQSLSRFVMENRGGIGKYFWRSCETIPNFV